MLQLAGPHVLPLFKLAKCVWAHISTQNCPKEEMSFVGFILLIYFCGKSYTLIVLCQNSLSSQRRLLNNSRIRVLA